MKGFYARNLGVSLPVYVTRKTATGRTADYSMSLWMTVVVMILAWLNAVVWGILGLYLAVRIFV